MARRTAPTYPGPAPAVCFGTLLRHPDHPGVTFVYPYRPGTVGGPQGVSGWNIPMVVVTEDLTVEQVTAAAEAVGYQFRLVTVLREAVRAWADGPDWRQNPHRLCPEWADPIGTTYA